MTDDQQKELCELLDEKYKVSDIRAIDTILRRTKMAILGENNDVFDLLLESDKKDAYNDPKLAEETDIDR